MRSPDKETEPTSQSTARSRILRGFAANTGGLAITLVIHVVSVPVFLSAWDIQTYGQWLVLSAIPTYVALSDFSFSTVAGNTMAMLEGAGKHSQAVMVGRRLWSIVTLMTGLAVLCAILLALLFGAVLGEGSAISAAESQVIVIALFLHVAVGNQYGVLDAWFRAAGRYPLGAVLRQLGRLFEFSALLVALLLGGSPGIAATAFLAGGIVGFGVAWIVLAHTVPWAVFRPERPDPETFRMMLKPGLAYLAFPVGNAMSLQGFTLVLGGVLGAPAVVVFSTTRTVTRVAIQAMSLIGSAIWPELSRAVGAGELGEARAILRRSVQLAILLSVACIGVVLFIGPGLISWWTGGRVDPPAGLLYLLLAVVLCNSIWHTLSTVLMATNQHRGLARTFLIGTGTALVLAVPLSYVIGLPGAAAALLAVDLSMIAYVVPAAMRAVDDDLRSFSRALLDFRLRPPIRLTRRPVSGELLPAEQRRGIGSRREPR